MHLGFALFRYFPFGGLQRDMLAIARVCAERGHRITIFTRAWDGPRPAFAEVKLLPAAGRSNHRLDGAFAKALPEAARAFGVERLVGFNKMPGLDVYYAADSCFAAKVFEERSALYRLLPRARAFMAMEKAVFSPGESTEILLISPPEREVYRRYYHTPEARLHLLPPGIRRDRIMPADYAERRRAFRAEQQWADSDKIVLFVGSGFRTKGLDRAIRAMAAQPANVRLLVLGSDKPQRFQALARRLKVMERVEFLGGLDNVVEYLWAADALLHPAYRENTGTVLLEAMVAGLPVVATDACGYAAYVRDGDMGEVIAAPVQQAEIDQALSRVLGAPANAWRERGAVFAREADIYAMPERACDLITGLSTGGTA